MHVATLWHSIDECDKLCFATMYGPNLEDISAMQVEHYECGMCAD